MVLHQAVCINPASELFFPVTQIFEVMQIVFIGCEDHLLVVAPLDYVVWIIGNYESSCPWHETPLSHHFLEGNK
jgi:hypothetical protein